MEGQAAALLRGTGGTQRQPPRQWGRGAGPAPGGLRPPVAVTEQTREQIHA